MTMTAPNIPLDVQAHGVVCAVAAARESLTEIVQQMPKSVHPRFKARILAETNRLAHAEGDARLVWHYAREAAGRPG